MSNESEVRALTRRGYKREDAKVWREEDTRPEHSAESVEEDAPPTCDPADWGRTQDEARDMLLRQMCPVCGEGPWQSPLNHAARKHGIRKWGLREACGLNTTTPVTAPELHERFAELGRGKDMDAILVRGPRGKRRFTSAGIAATASNLAEVTADQSRAALVLTKTPEAKAKHAEAMRALYASMTLKQKASRVAGLSKGRTSAEMLAQWDRRGRQGCGTVASYKRGCRCEPCRDAKRASRK